MHDPRLGRILQQVVEDRRLVDRRDGPVELGLHERERPRGDVAPVVEDGEEIPVPHDPDPVHRLGRRGVGAEEPGAVGRRAEEAGVEEAGEGEVPGVARLAGHLRHRVAAGRRPATMR
jgi:hypothetical protein